MNQLQRELHFGTRRQGRSRSVPLPEIKGSVGRCGDFDAAFRPLRPHMRERWIATAIAIQVEEPLPAVELVQINGAYFVVDGHHRISVARAQGMVAVDAHVIEWSLSN